MKAISLDSAIIVTEISKRTLWRRLTDGQIARLENDERGRAMLAFEDLVPLLCIPVVPEDYELFMDADAGDAQAQNDLALLFLEADKPEIALYWLQSAVAGQQVSRSAGQQVSRSAGQQVSRSAGQQVSRSAGQRGCNAQSCQALYQRYWRAEGRDMWLAKAAAHGHVIAEQQMNALMQRMKAE